MPRDGSGVYQLPGGFDTVKGIPGQPVESTPYNSVILDVEQDLNTPRPISAGGTGGTSPITARDGIDAEVATQVVTNFDTHIWEAGSFMSSAAAGSPVAGHDFYGICYIYGSGQDNICIEARDRSDNSVLPRPVYVREKKTGIWDPAWKREAYVKLGGDTMTGDLRVNRADAGQASVGYLMFGSGARFIGYNGTAYEFNASDPVISTSTPTLGQHLANKAYVDAADANINGVLATKAPINSPALTGTPSVPTPSGGSNNTLIANTQFVQGEIAAAQANASVGLVLIQAVSISGTNITFINLTNAYEKYVIELIDIQLSSNNQPINMLFSANNGSSFPSGNYVYHFMYGESGAAAVNGVNSTGTGSLPVSTMVLSNVAGRFAHITVEIPNPSSTPKDPVVHWRAYGWNGGGAMFNGSGAGSRQGWSSLLNAVQFSVPVGTITCKAKLYGMKK